MREIKFRAWDKVKKGMIYDNVEYDKRLLFEYASKDNPDRQPQHFIGYGDYDAQWFDIMQWTGLKDKNDRDIYEGDMIKIFNLIETIIFDGGALGYYLNNDRTDHFSILGHHHLLNWFGDKSEKVEVVGNIYEGEL